MINEINGIKIIKLFKEKIRQNDGWIIILFTRPSLYLFNLTKGTMVMGAFLFIIYLLLKYFGLHEHSIPSTLHGIIGIVIGLLLVFRTNTAYDRWWEARKIFSCLHSAFLFIRIKISIKTNSNTQEISKCLFLINKYIFEYISTENIQESIKIKQQFIESYSKLSKLLHTEFAIDSSYGNIDRSMGDILEYFLSLERIKDTPIPVSYSLHIKLSVFAYLLTLPLGLFFGMGIWSIPIVMVLYFIIAGIDIISSEIENPFHGDPNDLPIKEFEKENEKYING